MTSFDIKTQQVERKFDWDDIDVGNNQLNNSQNFFSKTHYEHERLDQMEFLRQKMVKAEIKEEILSEKENIKENCASPVDDQQNRAAKHKSPNTSRIDVKKVANNLANEWSTKKTVCSQTMASKGAIMKAIPPPPQAYLVKDIYQRKRQEAERRREEEERKMREFHPRPVPNFNQNYEMLKKQKSTHAVTIPVTPQVLKNSREADEKRRKKLEEWKQKMQPPKFEPRPLTVLKEKPFVPEKKPTMVHMCPFNLHSEKRLQERKHYDEIKRKTLEEKQKQVEIEEEQRRRVEKERIKELRKAATFKARPNPFKN